MRPLAPLEIRACLHRSRYAGAVKTFKLAAHHLLLFRHGRAVKMFQLFGEAEVGMRSGRELARATTIGDGAHEAKNPRIHVRQTRANMRKYERRE